MITKAQLADEGLHGQNIMHSYLCAQLCFNNAHKLFWINGTYNKWQSKQTAEESHSIIE